MTPTANPKASHVARLVPVRRTTRRTRIIAALLAFPSLFGTAAVAATATPAAAAVKPISYQLGWITNTEFAGTYIAQKDGYFSSGGLSVNLLPGGSDPVEPVVASGKALVGDSNADTVAAAVAAGANLRIIGARYQLNPFCIISSAKDPIKTPQDLIGKKIGINTYNLTAWNVFLALNHIKPSQVTTVDEGYSSGPTPLVNGQVDAWMGFSTNEPGVLTLAGFKNYSFLMSKFGYHVYADVYVTTTTAIKDDRPELVAFMKGELEGWTKDLANPGVGTALAVKEYEKKLGFSTAQQALENKAQKQLIVTPDTEKYGLFTMSRADIAQNLATLKFAQADGIAKYYTNSDLFYGGILKQALTEFNAGN